MPMREENGDRARTPDFIDRAADIARQERGERVWTPEAEAQGWAELNARMQEAQARNGQANGY